MTDRLQQARRELKTYYEQREYAAEHASDFAAENAADSLRLAELHAQLAQAEALTRIADVLERMEAQHE